MKITLSLCLLSAAACLTLAGDTPPHISSPKFTITVGSFTDDQHREVPVTIKMNAVTGETWQLMEIAIRTKDNVLTHALGWAPLWDDVFQTSLAASGSTTNAPKPK